MVMKNHHAGMDASEQPAQESRLLVVARRTATGSRLSHRLPDLHRMHPLTYRFRESPVFQGEDEADRDSDGPRHRARSPAPCGMVYGGQHIGMDDMWGVRPGRPVGQTWTACRLAPQRRPAVWCENHALDVLSSGTSPWGTRRRKTLVDRTEDLRWGQIGMKQESSPCKAGSVKSMTIRLHTDVQVKASS